MTKEFKILDYCFSFKGLKAEIQAFDQSFNLLTHIKSYKMERRGIIEIEEITEKVFFIMFGQEQLRQPEEFEVKKNQFLAKLNGKTLTIAELPGIKKEIKEIFNAHVSLDDKTETPEQHEKELVERNKLHAEHEAIRQEQSKQREIQKEALIKDYPYLQTASKDISARILATKNIRIELERAYPGHKFSITSETFSGGDSIDVRWTDGVTEKEIRDIIGKYQEGHFDGMTDSYNYSRDPFSDIFGGAKYVHGTRSYTMEKQKELAEKLGYEITFNEYKSFKVTKEGRQEDQEFSDILRSTSFYTKPEHPTNGGRNIEISSASGIKIQENKEKGGIEINFSTKPTAEVISKLKSNGFRWNGRTKVWYKKMSENARIFAESLTYGGKTTNDSIDDPEEELITQEQQTFERDLQREAISEQEQ